MWGRLARWIIPAVRPTGRRGWVWQVVKWILLVVVIGLLYALVVAPIWHNLEGVLGRVGTSMGETAEGLPLGEPVVPAVTVAEMRAEYADRTPTYSYGEQQTFKVPVDSEFYLEPKGDDTKNPAVALRFTVPCSREVLLRVGAGSHDISVPADFARNSDEAEEYRELCRGKLDGEMTILFAEGNAGITELNGVPMLFEVVKGRVQKIGLTVYSTLPLKLEYVD